MSAVNQTFFDRPWCKMRALGFGYEKESVPRPGKPGEKMMVTADDPNLSINGGIRSPVAHTIPIDTMIYRFGSNGVPAIVAMGEWWFDEDSFGKIRDIAALHRISFGEAVRATCYVPPEWSNLSTLVCAKTRDILASYRGRAAPVRIKAGDGTLTGTMTARNFPDRVDQLYIPGFASVDIQRQALGMIQPVFLPPTP